MSIVRARNWTTGGEPLGGFQDFVGGRLGLAEQVIGDGQAEQLFVGLGGLLGRLARGQLPEPLQPLPLELEELAGVVLVDRLQAGAGSARAQDFRLRPSRVILTRRAAFGPGPLMTAVATDSY